MNVNASGKWLPLAARTGTQSQLSQINDYFKGIKAYMKTTVFGASLTFGVYGYDDFGNEFTVAEKTVSGTGMTVISVHPALVSTNTNDILPRNWHMKVTPSDGSSSTYSTAFDLFP